MSNHLEESFLNIENKIIHLKNDFRQLEEKYKILQEELEVLKSENQKKQEKINQLTQENKNIKIQASVYGNHQYQNIMKNHINKLIKEVDYCINQIKNTGL